MAYVYRHIRLDKNVPFYIGIGKVDAPTYPRAKSSKYRNRYWHSINAKTKIRVDILAEDISYEQAKEKEVEFISIYKRFLDGGTLVNMTLGGEGTVGYRHKQLSERNKVGIWKGKHHTEATKKMMSLKMRGRKHTESALKNIREGHVRRKRAFAHNNPKWAGFVYVYSTATGELLNKYDSLQAASKAMNIAQGNLWAKVSGKKPNIYPKFTMVRTKENLLF